MSEQDAHTPPPLLSWQAVRLAFATPWKARNELERLAIVPLAWLGFVLSGVQIGAGWRCYGLPIVQKHRESVMVLGARANLRSHPRSNPLGPAHPCILSTRRAGAALRIGDDYGMTGGAIVCEEAITIGNRVTVGANSIIADTDFHPLDPEERFRAPLNGATAPIVIEDDVFIGMRALVLKGVRLGRGCVIGAGSVVTSDIPPYAIAAGNPARVLRRLR